MGDVRYAFRRDIMTLPKKDDIIVGDQKQKDLPGQDAQHDEDGVFDARPSFLEIHLREKELRRQGAGQEQRPDEERLQEAISQADEDERHQQDGDNPVGYDQQPFHYLHKNSK